MTYRFAHVHILVACLAVGAHDIRAQAARATDLPRIEGCYQLTVGPWANSTYRGPEKRVTIRLDTNEVQPAGLSGAPTVRRMVTLAATLGDPVSSMPAARVQQWFAIDSTISLIWSSGLDGSGATLNMRGDSLAGVLRAVADNITPEIRAATAPVSGRRIPCART